MKTYTKQDIDLMMAKQNNNKGESLILKYILATFVAIVLVIVYIFVLANIFLSGILTKGFILSLVALPFLVYITIRLNKRFK